MLSQGRKLVYSSSFGGDACAPDGGDAERTALQAAHLTQGSSARSRPRSRSFQIVGLGYAPAALHVEREIREARLR